MPNLRRFEAASWSKGQLVVGVDEVGAGCLAGPVMAAAVVLPVGWRHPDVNDSKLLSAAKREELAPLILREAIACAVGSVSPREIDRINIFRARYLAMRRAVAMIRFTRGVNVVLVDGTHVIPDVDWPQRNIIKGDTRSISIAAASIVAKVARDTLMRKLAKKWPDYGFEIHVGYPTPLHKRMLKKFGATPQHRMTFGPVAAVVK